ncbi:MAG TPA: hypothetical protein VLS25_05435, partial [Dehalococcoidia bacterium]|nr:hypothetical protein [Dehalococcoidia bacterium]
SAVPVDLFSSEHPQRFELDCGTHQLLAVFNWGDSQAEVRANLPQEPSHVFEAWGQRYLGVMSGMVSSEVPAHGCRLYAIRPATGRPQVIGSTFHLLQGTMELGSEEWDGEKLALSLQPVAKAEAEILIHVPSSYGGPEATPGAISDRGNGVWAIALRLEEEMRLEVRFPG